MRHFLIQACFAVSACVIGACAATGGGSTFTGGNTGGGSTNTDPTILTGGSGTGDDGILTALVILDLIARSGKTIDELTSDLKVFPQVIVNVRVREKRPLDRIPSVAATIQAAEEELKDTGRVVIRYSGTEALARVMIEAESEEAMRRHAEAIAAAIRIELGV